MVTEHKSFCRSCGGFCGIVVSVDEQRRVLKVRGDKSHPLTEGYACVKGVQMGEPHYSAKRILRPLKRQPDGGFSEISLMQALDEIAEKFAALQARDSGSSHAIYHGTQAAMNSTAIPLVSAWAQATNSRIFSSMSIDQSAKFMTPQRIGSWEAGPTLFPQADVWMVFGSNPLLSLLTGINGFTPFHPLNRIKEAHDRGMKIIVVDPRKTETAQHADVHLQPYPGEDATIAAGMIRMMLENGWHDQAFCERWVNGLEAMRAAVDPFTVDYVVARAGVDRHDFVRAVEIWGRDGKRGGAFSGTGPDMSHNPLTSEQLIHSLNVIGGRFLREGEKIQNPGVFSPRAPLRAQAHSPTREFESLPRDRIRGHITLFGEMMTGILPHEILTPGEGRVRSLFVCGGNPVAAIPDQRKVIAAFADLELLVCIDPFMSETARFAHYIIPPKLALERADVPNPLFERMFYVKPFTEYSGEIAVPPARSEVVDDWRFFTELAMRLGYRLSIAGLDVDPASLTSTDDVLKILVRDGQVPFEAVRDAVGGLFHYDDQYVSPADPDAQGRFELMPGDVAEEIRKVLARPYAQDAAIDGGRRYSYRLSVRRTREVTNSTGVQFTAERRRPPYNPLHVNPADMEKLGLSPSDPVIIESKNGRIEAMAAPDATMRPGVVSMTHAFGWLPDEKPYLESGAQVNLLISLDEDYEDLISMPRMSGIPVNIFRMD